MAKRALLSVTDKTGIEDFAKGLVDRGFEILSTGGTAAVLRSAGVSVTDVAAVTGFPEMLDGRIKTLHPLVHGGLLGDVRNPEHVSAMEAAGIQPISIVGINLYAFEQTISNPHTLEEAIESIDIGGPAMIRAAAKNYANVAVVVEPGDYQMILQSYDDGDLETSHLSLSAKAFRHTAYYDSVVSRYLTTAAEIDPLEAETLILGFKQIQEFRYGENPHQHGALYRDPLAVPLNQTGIVQLKQLWGKELSYNNLNDGDGAWELVADLPEGSCAIIKHGNPCGAAHGSSFAESYRLARASDPISAFGGIAAFNGLVDAEAANAMTEKGNFLEVVIGTGFTSEAEEIFKSRSGWGQDVRLLEAPLPGSDLGLSFKFLRGGAIVQETDEDPKSEWKVVSDKQPTESEMSALKLMWSIVQHVKSNAIVVGIADRMLGVGAGQMNRVQSVRLAIEQAGEQVEGAALASDAFFPFPDSVETAAAAGITAIVQPGGSKKDGEVIAAANRLGVALVFTGVRHFRH